MTQHILKNMTNLIKQDKNINLIISPPPNLTGNLHSGHILNFTLADFHVRYNFIFQNQNIVNVLGYDHAGLFAEILIKNTINNCNNIKISEIIEKIKHNSTKFKKQIQKQIIKYNFAMLDTNITTIDKQSIKIVDNLIKKLQNYKLIIQELKPYFHDYKNKTIVSDFDVETQIINKNLYIIKYKQVDSQNYICVGTTCPGTIESDICLVCNPKDTRYIKYINKYFINPITQNKIQLLTHSSVKINFGTGILKVTPIYDKNDLSIANDLKIKFNKINLPYNTNTLTTNHNSFFPNIDLIKIDNIALQNLQKNNNIESIQKINGKEYIVTKSQSKALTLMSTQSSINLKKLVSQTKIKYNKIEIIGSNGKNEIIKFVNNLNNWTITRQNNYGINYDKKNKLDTWVASSLYITMIVNKLKITNNKKIIIYTGYDIIFYWIYKMHYIDSFYTNKKQISKVVVHGLICDDQGNKMSKSKGNIIDINFKTKEEAENYKAGLLLLNIFNKRIKYDKQKITIPQKTINKIQNIIYLIKNKFQYIKYKKIITNQKTKNSIIYKMIVNKMIDIIDKNYILSLSNIIEFHQFIKQYFSNIFIEIMKKNINITQNYTKYNQILASSLNLILKYLFCFMPLQTEKIYKQIFTQEINVKYNFAKLKKYKCVETNMAFKILKLQKEKKIYAITLQIIDNLQNEINEIFYSPNKLYIITKQLTHFKLFYNPNDIKINNTYIQEVITKYNLFK